MATWLSGGSCDLDVLVRASDLTAVKSVMLAAGYATDLPADAAQEAAYLRARYELHFTTPDGVVPIEIHQAFLAPSYCLPFNYNALWQRLERQPFCGREVLALPAGDLLLMLCAHGAKHSWAELSAVCDIARLLVVAEDRIDWPAVLDEARAMGAIRILLLGLSLAADLLDAPLPTEVLAQARADRILVHAGGASARLLISGLRGGQRSTFLPPHTRAFPRSTALLCAPCSCQTPKTTPGCPCRRYFRRCITRCTRCASRANLDGSRCGAICNAWPGFRAKTESGYAAPW